MRMRMGMANCKWEWILREGGEGAGEKVAGGEGGEVGEEGASRSQASWQTTLASLTISLLCQM